jgi:hypothetical protein
MQDRIKILTKVSNKEITIEQADKELFVLYSINKNKEPKNIKHLNGTLRAIIKMNKENVKYWKEWNIANLKHCIAQLEKIENSELDCPYDFTSRCTMGKCDCKPIV